MFLQRFAYVAPFTTEPQRHNENFLGFYFSVLVLSVSL